MAHRKQDMRMPTIPHQESTFEHTITGPIHGGIIGGAKSIDMPKHPHGFPAHPLSMKPNLPKKPRRF